MYILSMEGRVLAEFDKWDISSVAKAEKWISDNGYIIWKCEISILGTYLVTVRTMY